MTRSLATSLLGVFGILAIAGEAFGRPIKWSDGTQRLAFYNGAAPSDPTTGSFGRQVDGKHKLRGSHENSWSGVLAQEEGPSRSLLQATGQNGNLNGDQNTGSQNGRRDGQRNSGSTNGNNNGNDNGSSNNGSDNGNNSEGSENGNRNGNGPLYTPSAVAFAGSGNNNGQYDTGNFNGGSNGNSNGSDGNGNSNGSRNIGDLNGTDNGNVNDVGGTGAGQAASTAANSNFQTMAGSVKAAKTNPARKAKSPGVQGAVQSSTGGGATSG